MSPRIQGDGGRLRLEWTHLRAESFHARAGLVRLNVWRAFVWSWEVSTDRHRLAFGECETVLEAQAACESAARDLLCSALAAFCDTSPVTDVVRVDGTNCPGTDPGHANVCAYDFQGAWTVWLGIADPEVEGDTGASIAFNPDDARRLAIALLSASQAVHLGSRPAGEEGK